MQDKDISIQKEDRSSYWLSLGDLLQVFSYGTMHFFSTAGHVLGVIGSVGWDVIQVIFYPFKLIFMLFEWLGNLN